MNVVEAPASRILYALILIIIGTKWVCRNKMGENGIIIRNKARLVAQGYNQQEGTDYDAMRMLLAFSCYKKLHFISNGCEKGFIKWFHK